MALCNITDFGAVGDGVTLNTAAIQKAIDACHAAGGGRVLVPAPGRFLSGTILLRSHLDLHLEGGATLLGSPRREDYPNERLRCLIESDGADGISLTGMGVIDGQALAHMVEDLRYIYRGNPWRPRLVGLVRGRGVTVRDLTLRNSANWGLHLSGCQDVVIHGLRIENDLKVPNCDGIDPDHCRNVRISDCHISAGDDCIVLKNTADFADCGPTENVTITGCTCVSTSAAVKIGTESVSDFRNIVVSGCVIQSSSRGLAIQLRDQGNVENVLFANCVVETRLFEDHWWGKAEPIYVTALRRFAQAADAGKAPAWNPRNELGRVRRVRFSNILCRGENGAFIAGEPGGGHIEDVVLDNVRLEVDKWSKWPGGLHDRRPCDALGPAFRDPSQDPGLRKHPTAGVYVEHARDVVLRHTRVVWGGAPETRPEYFRHALEAHHAPGLRLEGFAGEAAHPQRDAAQVVD